MSPVHTASRILLLSGDLAGNLGDRAIRAVIVDRVRQVAPAAELWSVSREPERDAREFGVRVAAASAPALLGKPAFLRTITATLFGGGQMLQDDSSQLKNMHWAVVLNGVRRLSGGPVMGYGLGIGPLQTACGRYCASRAIRALDRCIARDARSAQWVTELSDGRVSVGVAPDPALVLSPAPRASAQAWLGRMASPDADELLVGVSIRRFFSGRRGILPSAWTARFAPEGPSFRLFKQHLAEALNRFAAGRRVRVLFFSMYQSAWQDDARQSREVAAGLSCPSHVLDRESDCRMVKALEGLCGLFVGVPMHSTILSMGMGVPTLGLVYADKGRDLYDACGLGEWVLPVEAVAAADGATALHERMEQLFARRAAVRELLVRQRAGWADRMAPYTDWLAGLLAEQAPPRSLRPA